MCSRVRIVVVCLAFLSLAFSCSEGGSYIVDTAEPGRIVTLLDHWASGSGFSGTDCAKDFYLRTAITGTCFELAESEEVTRSVLVAEELEPGRTVRVWMSFKGIAESQRIKTLDSLGAVLTSEFGPDNVRREE
jgi:hypothetical protein